MSDPRTVHQLRVVVEADDYDAAVAFYRDALGMPELAAFAEGGDDRVAILDAGRATLELASPAHKRTIDRVEAQGLTSPRIRIALEVDDTAGHTHRLVEAGAALVAEPVMTPWRSLNSRLEAPAGLTITLFQETEDETTRTGREGFARDAERDGDG
jgi:catechol 2,3-dioxygenase-like lactoylglutathione lyase family enzyme